MISVVLPNRNHGSHLRSSIPRFLKQTYPDFELIVVDDLSGDDSCAVVQSFAAIDKRVRLLRLSEHSGVAGAFERGLAQAKGAYIYGAAADDFVRRDFFERSIALLESSPSAAFCFSDPTERHADGTRRSFPLYLSERPRAFSAIEMEDLLSRGYFHFSSNTAIFRRNEFIAAGGLNKDLMWLCDWFVTNVLALRHGACYVPDTLTEFQIAEGSYSAVGLKRTQQQRELFGKVLMLLHTPPFADVLPAFKRAALLPEYRLRTLWWLLHSDHGISFLSPRMMWRVLTRGLLYYARSFMPASFRRALRRIVASRGR